MQSKAYDLFFFCFFSRRIGLSRDGMMAPGATQEHVHLAVRQPKKIVTVERRRWNNRKHAEILLLTFTEN